MKLGQWLAKPKQSLRNTSPFYWNFRIYTILSCWITFYWAKFLEFHLKVYVLDWIFFFSVLKDILLLNTGFRTQDCRIYLSGNAQKKSHLTHSLTHSESTVPWLIHTGIVAYTFFSTLYFWLNHIWTIYCVRGCVKQIFQDGWICYTTFHSIK